MKILEFLKEAELTKYTTVSGKEYNIYQAPLKKDDLKDLIGINSNSSEGIRFIADGRKGENSVYFFSGNLQHVYAASKLHIPYSSSYKNASPIVFGVVDENFSMYFAYSLQLLIEKAKKDNEARNSLRNIVKVDWTFADKFIKDSNGKGTFTDYLKRITRSAL